MCGKLLHRQFFLPQLLRNIFLMCTTPRRTFRQIGIFCRCLRWELEHESHEENFTTLLLCRARGWWKRKSLFNTIKCCVSNRLFSEHPTKWKIVCVERTWLRPKHLRHDVQKIFRNFHNSPLMGATMRMSAGGRRFLQIFFSPRRRFSDLPPTFSSFLIPRYYLKCTSNYFNSLEYEFLQ